VVEREAPGAFDDQFDDPSGVDGLDTADHAPEEEAPGRFDYLLANRDDDADDNLWNLNEEPVFDAFNTDTWRFTPAPTPWYRGTPAMTALIAAATAVVAIVVSGVLLVFRGPSRTVQQSTPVTQTATATSVAPATVASSVALPPPPPPSASVASSVNPAPKYNYPSGEPPPTNAPEIGVTHTPITRSSLSAAPQPRRPSTQPMPTGGGHGGR
jgi:hypothetical protein